MNLFIQYFELKMFILSLKLNRERFLKVLSVIPINPAETFWVTRLVKVEIETEAERTGIAVQYNNTLGSRNNFFPLVQDISNV